MSVQPRSAYARRFWGGRCSMVVLILGLLLAANFFGMNGRSEGFEGRMGFVYRDGDRLMLNGAPYRFIGVNNYDLTGCHTGKPVSESDADMFFAQLPPLSMTRVWAFENYGIEGVEQTVRLAEKHGQKLILALADGAGHCGAPDFDATWYEQGFRGSYFAWVARLATAFKDSQAVAIWELMNEPGSTVDNLSASVIKQFYDATAAHIKQNDSLHLVSTGALAPWQTFQEGVAGYAEAHSGADIDLVSVHEYDYPYSDGQTVISPHFESAREAAQAVGKPVYVGETGISLSTGCMSGAERAEALRQKFDAYLAAGAAGVLYWVVMGPPNNPGTVCNSEFGNRDPMLGGAIMNMISEYWQMPGYAIR
jgi:mannan endo-1,4-beta-mannosidase